MIARSGMNTPVSQIQSSPLPDPRGTHDGHRRTLDAVESAFGAQIDYAILINWQRSRRRAAILAAGLPRGRPDRCHQQSQPVAHLHVIRGAADLDRSHDDAPLQAVVEWFQRQGRESHSGRGDQLLRLQLPHQDSQVAENVSRDGRRPVESTGRRVESCEPADRIRVKKAASDQLTLRSASILAGPHLASYVCSGPRDSAECRAQGNPQANIAESRAEDHAERHAETNAHAWTVIVLQSGFKVAYTPLG